MSRNEEDETPIEESLDPQGPADDEEPPEAPPADPLAPGESPPAPGLQDPEESEDDGEAGDDLARELGLLNPPPSDARTAYELFSRMEVERDRLIWLELLRRQEERQRMLQLFLNEGYLADLKREFLKFRIFFFHDDNQDFTALTPEFVEERFQAFREDIAAGLKKTFDAFDEQEISFKIDRLYKWNRIVNSGDIDFFIFYKRDRLEEKETKILDPLFCRELVHPTPIKQLLPSLVRGPREDGDPIGNLLTTMLVEDDGPGQEKAPLGTGQTKQQSEAMEVEVPAPPPTPESPEQSGTKKVRSVARTFSLLVPKNSTKTSPVQSSPTPPDTSLFGNLHEHPAPATAQRISRDLHSGIQKIVPENSFSLDPTRSFDEFFNVNPEKVAVSPEYDQVFSKIISRGDYLSFPINNEFIMLLKPRTDPLQQTPRLLQYPVLLKTLVLPFLSTSDLLVLRTVSRVSQDIIKSVWHTIYKQEMSEQVMHVRFVKYQESIAEFLKTIEDILTNLVQVTDTVCRTLVANDLLALATDFEHPQEAQQARLLLLVIGKLASWEIFEGSLGDGVNAGTWAEVAPKVRVVLESLGALIAEETPPVTFEHLKVVDEVFLNEFLIRSQNLRDQRLILLRVFIQQLVLVNIIKQKSLVSKRLILFFENQINSSRAAKGSNSTQIKRILHILISKNFLGDDSASSKGFMENFNQTFSEIIGIISQVRNLNYSDAMLGQVMADYPALARDNPFFGRLVLQMPEARVLRALESASSPAGELKPDFLFNVHSKVYTVSLDRHSKHKIFYESVAESSARDLLKKIQGVLSRIDSFTQQLAAQGSQSGSSGDAPSDDHPRSD